MLMTFFSAPELRRKAQAFANARDMPVAQALRKHARLENSRYDVFLSQAIKDREVVLGVYAVLTEDLGLCVFCDWLEEPTSDHSSTTPQDAAYLRRKLDSSTALVFIDSDHAQHSTWMSWEIGWFDAAKGRVCVLPVVAAEKDDYRGREFLGLYPVAEKDARHGLMVSVPLAKVAAMYPPGTPLGIATRLPLSTWASLERLPGYFLR